MIKTSCVRYPKDDTFVIVRACYVTICHGNATAAALIHYFEMWHNTKVAARENHLAQKLGKDHPAPSLWQYHSNKSLESALMGIGKRHAIDNAKQLLQSLGVVEIQRNENASNPVDAITHYLFHPDRVNDLLSRAVGDTPPAENSTPPVQKSAPGGAENSNIIYSNIDSGQKESSAPVGAVKVDKRKKVSTPPRPYWQKFVETFHEDYKARKNGEKPTIDGRPVGDLAKLYDRLFARCRSFKREWTEAYMIESFSYFLNSAAEDDWLNKHWLVQNLVEQWDAVFARKAEERKKNKPVEKKQTAPASNSSSKSHIEYLLGRWLEGNFDEQFLSPDYYDHLVILGMVPANHIDTITTGSIDARKIKVVRNWLNLQKQHDAKG